MLYRRRDIKRLFAYSSIEHMGIIAFAFGMGGPLANFAGLLHMTMHSLTKSAIFFTVGHIAQVKGTQKIADIRGLTVTHPVLGWRWWRASSPSPACRRSASSPQRVPGGQLDLRAPAAAGRPAGARPAGRLRRPAAAAAGPGLRRAQPRRRAGARPPTCRCSPIWRWCWPPASIFPPLITAWFQHVARAARMTAGRALQTVDADGWRHADRRRLARGGTRGRLRRRSGATPGRVHMARRRGAGEIGDRSASPAPTARFPRSARATRRRSGWSARSSTCSAWSPRRARRAALARSRPLGRPPSAGRTQRPRRRPSAYAFLPPRARACTRSPSGRCTPAIIEPGHFRFTASGETVVRLEERLGYVHRGIEGA